MTHKVIYHDFQQPNASLFDPESSTVLTATVLTKGRRWYRFWGNLQKAMEAICLALCGISIIFSIVVLTALL